MNFTLSNAIHVANWMEESYKKYLLYLNEGGPRIEYQGNVSGDWDSEGSIRVSKIAGSCPLRIAAEAKGLVEREKFPVGKLLLFEDARRVAEVVYESLEWAGSAMGFEFRAEERVLPDDHWTKLVGTIDGVISVDGIPMPVEVKRTDNDKYGKPRGISPSHMMQVIGEMIILGNEEGNYGSIPFGYIFSRYSADSDPICKVWIVSWDSELQGWFLYDKGFEQSAPESEWKTLPDGRIFVSLLEYLDLYQAHKEYAELDNPLGYEPPFGFLEDGRCAKVKPTEYYAPTGKYKGARNPKTGKVFPKCPLFESCFGEQLHKGGYDTKQDEYDLELLR